MWLDELTGDGGDDILYGFEGDDTIAGGVGSDRIFGDTGNDTIFMGDALMEGQYDTPELVDAG